MFHVGWVEPMMIATAFFLPTSFIETKDVLFIQGETQHKLGMLGVLENQRGPRLPIRELQGIRNTAGGCRCRGLLGFAFSVPVDKYCRRLVSAERPRTLKPSIRSTQPTIRAEGRKGGRDVNR